MGVWHRLREAFVSRPLTPAEQEVLRERLFVRVAKLKKLQASAEWQEYAALIEEYIDRCRFQKLRYNFAHAYQMQDEKTFRHAAFLDNDIDFAQRLLGLPRDFVFEADEQERQRHATELEQEEAHAGD